ncbi:MAG: Xaa-Pro peptidase family protein, partial [Dehalococcoidia bacterium]|nr:Xaa-Pro peptidase family protein [Dehalococcoidia bacterium]
NDQFFDMGMANIRYVTQIGSKMGACVIFPLMGAPIVFSGPPHMNVPFSVYQCTQNWVSDIRPYIGMGPLVEALKELGNERATIGLVAFGHTLTASSLNHSDYVQLVEALPSARFLDANPLLNHIRLVKSDEEIRMLKKAGEIAHLAIEAMIEGMRPGATESELYAKMFYAQVSNGAEPQNFILLSTGSIDSPPGACHLLHGVDQPAAPSMRRLSEGDLAIVEFHTCYGGYLAATEFSVFLGKAPPQLRHVHEVAVECFHSGAAKMRPGTTLGELRDAFRAPCQRAGLDFLELGFHSHGLASPEFPITVYKPGAPLLSGAGTEDLVLKENMVFGTNIDIHDPNWRTDVGLMLGDMIQVTGKGPVPLVNTPMEFPEVAV